MPKLIAITLTAALFAAPVASATELRFAKANLKLTVPEGCSLTKDADKEMYSGRCTNPASTLVIQALPMAEAKGALEKMHTGAKEGLTEVRWGKVRADKTPSGHERTGRGMTAKVKSGVQIVDQYRVVQGAADQAVMIAVLATKTSDMKAGMGMGMRLMGSLDDVEAPADLRLRVSGDASKCAKTAVKELRHTPAGKDQPLKFDTAQFTHGKARHRARVNKLELFIASKDWPLEAYGTVPFEVASDKGGYLSIRIIGKALGAGTYNAKRGKEPIVKMDIISKGLIAAKNLGETSTVTITAITKDKVCGSFDLMGVFGGEHTRATGTFVAPLPQ
ncbi:MAG: hypothetical protein ACI9OJ_002464 [Myxococcota bacterium]|jgi:hypothetical protein